MHRSLRLPMALAGLLFAGSLPAAGAPRIEFLNSGKVNAPGFPFSEGVRVGDTVYLSGQVGVRPGTDTLVPGGIREEARQTLENIRTSLDAHGVPMSHCHG